MMDQKKRTYRSETLSLLTLKLILTEAKKESPPQMRCEHSDANEELALKLIARMKKEYGKADVVTSERSARSNLLANEGIASDDRPRNDIKVEP